MYRILKICVLGIVLPVVVLADLESLANNVAEKGIDAATKIALNNKGKIVLNNVVLDCKFDAKESLLIGNGCNQMKANDIQAFNVKFKAKVKMERSVVIGNAGNSIGK